MIKVSESFDAKIKVGFLLACLKPVILSNLPDNNANQRQESESPPIKPESKNSGTSGKAVWTKVTLPDRTLKYAEAIHTHLT